MVPIKKRLSLCVSKMQQTASMAVLYTHRYCSRLRLCLSRGHENCAMAEIQLPHGTGLHATLPAANTTRKQRATPPKPSTINLCLFSHIYVASFLQAWLFALHSTQARNAFKENLALYCHQKNPKTPPTTPKQQKTPKLSGGEKNYTICHLIL